MKKEVLGVGDRLQFEKSSWEVVAVHDEYGVGYYYKLCGFGGDGNACCGGVGEC